jgi:hypothetical protein
MAVGVLTPLQLTAAAGLLDNQGLKPLPTEITTAVAAWNATTVITAINSALSDATGSVWCSATTLGNLGSLRGTGNGCPALGNSIPPAYTNISLGPDASQPGFSGLIVQTGNAYLGDGDAGRFAQGFMAVQGLVQQTNEFISSANNAQTYLGPTFTGMADLITNNIASVNTNLPAFAADLKNQGYVNDFANLPFYGTPAGLLSQISSLGNMLNGTLPSIRITLIDEGLTDKDIADLVNLNVVSLFNPGGLSVNDFDKLQKKAYPALTKITDADLSDVKNILQISTPNISSLADLLDPRKIFPLSYTALQTPTSAGYKPIFGQEGSVNMDLQPEIGNFISTPSGCDQLSKIIPPDQAVANKAIESALNQISGISNTDAPALGNSIQQGTRLAWQPDQSYQQNTLVARSPTDPVTDLAQLAADTMLYRAQQDVPTGIDITDTNYWQPTTEGKLCELAGLDLINDQSQPLPSSAVNYFDNSLATGTGPDGTITTCDVIGTAINRGNLQIYLDAATSALQDIIDDGGAATLLDIYSRMANVADGSYGDPVLGPVTVPVGAGAGTYTTTFAVYAGDAALQVLIPLANTEIDSIIAAYPSDTTTLNSNWNSLAEILDSEKGYQIECDLDYFALPAGNKTSVMSFIQTLPSYGLQGQACGPFDFLDQVADKTTLTGQAIEGSLCEGENQALLGAAGMGAAAAQTRPSDQLAVTPPFVAGG